MRIIYIVCFLIKISETDSQSYPLMIPVAALFRNYDEAELQSAFKEAIYYHNTNNASQLLFTIDDTERIMKSNMFDVWEITRMLCAVAKKGYFYVMGSGDYSAYDAFSSVSQKLNMPFINLAIPPTEFISEYEVVLKPSLIEIIADIIEAKQWYNVSYIYDGPQGLINLEQLSEYLMNKKRFPLVVHIKQLPDTSNIKEMNRFFYNFHETHNSPENHVILDVSTSRKLNLTLNSLREIVVKTRNVHYLIASLEITEDDITNFRYGVVNITGLQLVQRDSYEFLKFMQRWRQLDGFVAPGVVQDKISIDAALAYDSINVAATAVKNLLNNDRSGLFNNMFRSNKIFNYGYPGVYCFPAEDKAHPNRPFRTLKNGNLLANYLRNIVTNGLTGRIEFNERGFRKNYELEVLEVLFYGNTVTRSVETRSKWIEGVGFLNGSGISIPSVNPPEAELPEDDGRPLIITTVISKPFVMEKINIEKYEGNDRYEGYCVDLMALLAQNLSRKFIIEPVADKKYGNVGSNGEWDGMIGVLLRNDADMAVAPLTINRLRERVVDFSKPFMTTGISIMIKKPDKQEFSVFSFMQPLATDVWMYIIFAYIGVSIMIFLVARFSPYEWRVEENANGNIVVYNDFSLYNCLWFTLAAFMQQGTDILPRSVSGRIGSSAWWFFTMIVVSSYTANLAAFLTLEKMHPSIGSAEELAYQSKIKYGIQENGSTATFFKESTFPIYQRMWAYMSTEKGVFVSNYEAGVKKVRESKGLYAFLLELTSNEFFNTRKPCDTMKAGEMLNTLGYGVATKFGSPLRNRINLIILELLERGELKKLENRWWYEKSQCEQGMTDSQSASLTLSKVAGIFYILIGGMVLAMAAALGEFFYRSKIDAGANRGLSGMVQTRLSVASHKSLSAKPSGTSDARKENDDGYS